MFSKSNVRLLIISLYLIVCPLMQLSFASDWQIKSDIDHEGPRCIFWAYANQNLENIPPEYSRISHFTVFSTEPFEAEFSYKFPNTSIEPQNIRVVTKRHGYPMQFQNGYAWTYSKRADSSLIQDLMIDQKFEVRFTLNGKDFIDKYIIYGFDKLLKELSIKCKLLL